MLAINNALMIVAARELFVRGVGSLLEKNSAGLEYVLLPAHCGYVLEIPPCVRVETGTAEVLGLARPNWHHQLLEG